MDTSGSIDRELLNQFASEITAILEDHKTTCNVLYCDSKVAGMQEFTQDDLPLQLQPAGGGGTDFRPAFEWVDGQGINPSCMIYLTDLMGRFPEHEPGYPVLWVVIGNRRAVPFGETISIT